MRARRSRGNAGPVTDGDALLAIAQDALAAAEQSGGATRRTRYRLAAHVDPLSGWARLRDGELLLLTSLHAVMRSLPGRGGNVRLRPVTAAALRRFDLGRSQREVSANLRELLGTVDGEGCRFPGAAAPEAARPPCRALERGQRHRPRQPRQLPVRPPCARGEAGQQFTVARLWLTQRAYQSVDGWVGLRA